MVRVSGSGGARYSPYRYFGPKYILFSTWTRKVR